MLSTNELMLLNCGAGEDSRFSWFARRLYQSILKEMNLEYVLEGLMMKLHHFGHLLQRAEPWEKTLVMGRTEGKRRKGQQRMRW